MNQIAWLEKSITEIQHVIEVEQECLENSPGDFGAQLTIANMESHLKEQQRQLVIEKEEREKEIIELRFSGQLADFGAIPLDLLSKIAQYISKGIHSAVYRQRKGKDPKSKIPNDIINTVDLRLAGIASGSTNLYITSACSPNLWGESPAEMALGKTFTLLNSEDTNSLTEAVAVSGIRHANNIAGLCKTLTRNNLELEVSWGNPKGEKIYWNGTSATLTSLAETIEAIAISQPEEVAITGKLIMGSLKGRFEIDGQDGKTYSGAVPEDLLNKFQGFNLGQTVTAYIKTETTINPISGYEKKSYTLLDLKKPNEKISSLTIE